MEIIHHSKNFPKDRKSIVTIGTFDGVHIGHQKIIKDLVASAKNEGLCSVVFTFYPHPRMVLSKNSDLKLIQSIEERADQLAQTGLDYLIIHPFDKEFSRMSAFEFVRDVLVEQLHVQKLIIGYDHHFGKNREGNIDQLREYSHIFDFEVEEIPAQDIDDVSVSSTKIRTALEEGEIEKANNYLGHDFSLRGTVIKGNQIGKTLGFPTANLNINNPHKQLPKPGAYIVNSVINGTPYPGMLNIGFRPTIDGKKQSIEVYFEGLDQDLYGKEIRLNFKRFLREEIRFENLEKLKEQLQKDRNNLLKYLR
ncbi:MAG: bifunctional riboflavin kinase/FAD synthetase [Flavobacteriaceae bacterium]